MRETIEVKKSKKSCAKLWEGRREEAMEEERHAGDKFKKNINYGNES